MDERHGIAGRARGAIDHLLSAVGMGQSEERRIADARAFWSDETRSQWADQSHWRGGSAVSDQVFADIGRDSLAIFDRLTGGVRELGRVIEWGAGGGANAVAFAPRATEFTAVDVVASSPAECARQVARVCDTPVVPVTADVADPEATAATLPGGYDLFLCLYVLELVPSPEYGLRLLRLAAELLAPGGLAFVQFRYATAAGRTGARRRNYRRNAAIMTSYRVEEFWTAARDAGLDPEVMTLVPENALDERYAYVVLRRPS